MNLKSLSMSVVAAVTALVLAPDASAQFSTNGTGFNVGVGGGYSKTTLPNGQSITNSNVNWGVGVGGAYTTSTLPYGGYGYGGWGGGWGGYGGGYCPPAVLPYPGGFAVYSPFTRTYGNPCYGPAFVPPCAPVGCRPQYVVW